MLEEDLGCLGQRKGTWLLAQPGARSSTGLHALTLTGGRHRGPRWMAAHKESCIPGEEYWVCGMVFYSKKQANILFPISRPYLIPHNFLLGEKQFPFKCNWPSSFAIFEKPFKNLKKKKIKLKSCKNKSSTGSTELFAHNILAPIRSAFMLSFYVIFFLNHLGV